MGDFIYLAGGLLPDGGVATIVERYDTRANGWRRMPDLPVPLHHATGVNYRDGFVVIGGFTDRGTGNPSRRVFALAGDSWDELPRLRRARGAGAAAVIGGRIYVVGGRAGDTLVVESERFNGKRWRDIAPIPTPRDHLAAAADGRYLYAVGGRRLAIERTIGRLERYDPKKDTWTRLPKMPTPRGGIGAVLAGTRLVVAGGEGSRDDAGPDGVFEQVELYNTATERWERIADLATPRHGVGVALVGSTVYVAVGGPTVGSSYSATLEALDLQEMQIP